MTKKLIPFLFFFIYQTSFACSSCNVEFSEEERLSFIVSVILLIVIPLLSAYFLFKWIKNNYR